VTSSNDITGRLCRAGLLLVAAGLALVAMLAVVAATGNIAPGPPPAPVMADNVSRASEWTTVLGARPRGGSYEPYSLLAASGDEVGLHGAVDSLLFTNFLNLPPGRYPLHTIGMPYMAGMFQSADAQVIVLPPGGRLLLIDGPLLLEAARLDAPRLSAQLAALPAGTQPAARAGMSAASIAATRGKLADAGIGVPVLVSPPDDKGQPVAYSEAVYHIEPRRVLFLSADEPLVRQARSQQVRALRVQTAVTLLELGRLLDAAAREW
jgi:hypothetical protein